jgi:hypothetical protein
MWKVLMLYMEVAVIKPEIINGNSIKMYIIVQMLKLVAEIVHNLGLSRTLFTRKSKVSYPFRLRGQTFK